MTKADQTSRIEGCDVRLNQLIDQVEKLVNQLDTVGETLDHAIRSGHIEQVVEIVSKREPLVSEIVRIGEDIGAIIEDPSMTAQMSVVERSDSLGRIAQVEQTMQRVRKRDAQDQKLMETTRDNLAGQIAGMGTTQNALRAYSGRQATPNPILQDRCG